MKKIFSLAVNALVLFFVSNCIHAQPLIVDAGQDTSICNGYGIQIGGTPVSTGGTLPYTYIWSPPVGLSNNLLANPIANPISTTTYTITVTDGLGSTATDNVTITVNPLPIANAGIDQTICLGATTTLSASGGIDYAWSPAYGLSGTSSANESAMPSTTTTYTLYVSDANGCSATDVITIFVTQALNVSVQNTNASCGSCNDGSATLNVSGGAPPYVYQWFTSPVQTASTATGLLPGYCNFLVTDNNYCHFYDTTVISSGNCSALFSLNADSIVQHHYYAINSSSGVPPIQYLWSWGDGTQDTIAYPNHTYNVAGYYTICLTITDSVACTNMYWASLNLQKTTNTLISVEVIPDVVTELNEISNNSLLYTYPNPVTNYFTIKTVQKSVIDILNISGQIIKSIYSNSNETKVDLTDISSGVYIVRVKTDKGFEIKKFIKE